MGAQDLAVFPSAKTAAAQSAFHVSTRTVTPRTPPDVLMEQAPHPPSRLFCLIGTFFFQWMFLELNMVLSSYNHNAWESAAGAVLWVQDYRGQSSENQANLRHIHRSCWCCSTALWLVSCSAASVLESHTHHVWTVSLHLQWCIYRTVGFGAQKLLLFTLLCVCVFMLCTCGCMYVCMYLKACCIF